MTLDTVPQNGVSGVSALKEPRQSNIVRSNSGIHPCRSARLRVKRSLS